MSSIFSFDQPYKMTLQVFINIQITVQNEVLINNRLFLEKQI